MIRCPMQATASAQAIADFIDAHSRTWILAKAAMMTGKHRDQPLPYQLIDAADLAVLFGVADSFASSRGFGLDDLQAGFVTHFADTEDGDQMLRALPAVCDVPELAGLIDAAFDTVRLVLTKQEPPSTTYCRLVLDYEAALTMMEAALLPHERGAGA